MIPLVFGDPDNHEGLSARSDKRNGVDPDLFMFAPVWRGGHAPVSGLICLSPEHDKQNKSGSKSKNDVGE